MTNFLNNVKQVTFPFVSGWLYQLQPLLSQPWASC